MIFTDCPWFDLRALEAIFFCLSKKKINGPSSMDKVVQYIVYGTNVMEKIKEIADSYKKGFHPLITRKRLGRFTRSFNNSSITFF